VQHQEHARRRIEWLAIHADVGVLDLIVGVQHFAIRIGNAAIAKHRRHLFAATVA
jgi:hypothetical protein